MSDHASARSVAPPADPSAGVAAQNEGSFEAPLRAVLDASNDGFMLLESVRDAAGAVVDFRWRYANPMAGRIVGRPPDWFPGQLLLEAMPGNRAEGLFDAYVRVVETGEPWTTELTYAHEGVNAYIRLTAARAGDGFGVTFSDLSERRRAEDLLRESEARFRTMADHAPVMVWVSEPDGMCTYLSASWYAFTGQPPETGLGLGWLSAVHPEDQPLTSASFLAANARHEPFRIDYRLRRADGVYRWAIDSAVPRFGPGGAFLGYIGSVLDITERKQAEQRLRAAMEREQALRREAEEASRLKDEFLATVSHELRTPLTAFLGYAQLLRARRRDEAYVARAVEKMVQSAQAQAQLIEDLLDMSRIVSGKLHIELAPVDLAAVVQAALDTVRPAVQAKGLRVKLSLAPRASRVIGDPGRLQQVVWNLLSNATKFTPAGGHIAVRLEAQDGDVALSVRDTGQGIPAEFLPFVFDRFRQADSTSQRAHGGLGLGLAIVRHLVELHGGAVSAASDGPGAGATFTVRLPLAPTGRPPELPGPEPDAEALSDPCPPELAGLRVLLVDDQRAILDLLEEILAPCATITRSVTSAPEALAQVRSWQPDLLVSDIAMPGTDGYWLIGQVRALPPHQGGNTPAVALTAYVRVEDRLQTLAAGFQLYIPKPVEPVELRAALAQLVRSAMC